MYVRRKNIDKRIVNEDSLNQNFIFSAGNHRKLVDSKPKIEFENIKSIMSHDLRVYL